MFSQNKSSSKSLNSPEMRFNKITNYYNSLNSTNESIEEPQEQVDEQIPEQVGEQIEEQFEDSVEEQVQKEDRQKQTVKPESKSIRTRNQKRKT